MNNIFIVCCSLPCHHCYNPSAHWQNIGQINYSIFTPWKLWKRELLSCVWLCDPLDYSPLGSCFHRISWARVLEGVAISFSRGFSWPRDWIWADSIAVLYYRRILHYLNHQGTPYENYKSSENKQGLYVSKCITLKTMSENKL